jgi:hypothetical protein
MTDEQIWLLRFGSGWVNWWELADESGDDINPVAERMHEAQMLEKDAKRMRVRLKTKEEMNL